MNNKNDEALRSLSRGFHKSALAIREVSTKQETFQKATEARTSALEQAVFTGSSSMQSRQAVLEARLGALETQQKAHEESQSAVVSARVSGRATVAAAWIGGVVTFLIAIIGLVMAIYKG
jgi:hypothetical protein